MTAKQSIIAECRRCCGGAGNWKSVCASYDCPIHFSQPKGASVRKIKAFCLQCVPERSVFGVKACEGKYLDGKICDLHPYRNGKNPNRAKRVWTAEQRSEASQSFARNLGRDIPKAV